jgi:tetratricopeptide (TPR) repeat protein
MEESAPQPVDLVHYFLRGQNLEQLGRLDEAAELYERCVTNRFDSTGPYDRLIALYADQARHADVVRVAETALAAVQTHTEKRSWFDRMRADALKASQKVPRAAPKKRSS